MRRLGGLRFDNASMVAAERAAADFASTLAERLWNTRTAAANGGINDGRYWKLAGRAIRRRDRANGARLFVM